MPKMLRDKRDGMLYPMNADLARHEEMEVVDDSAAENPVGSAQAVASDSAEATMSKTTTKRTKQSSE